MPTRTQKSPKSHRKGAILLEMEGSICHSQSPEPASTPGMSLGLFYTQRCKEKRRNQQETRERRHTTVCPREETTFRVRTVIEQQSVTVSSTASQSPWAKLLSLITISYLSVVPSAISRKTKCHRVCGALFFFYMLLFHCTHHTSFLYRKHRGINSTVESDTFVTKKAQRNKSSNEAITVNFRMVNLNITKELKQPGCLEWRLESGYLTDFPRVAKMYNLVS